MFGPPRSCLFGPVGRSACSSSGRTAPSLPTGTGPRAGARSDFHGRSTGAGPPTRPSAGGQAVEIAGALTAPPPRTARRSGSPAPDAPDASDEAALATWIAVSEIPGAVHPDPDPNLTDTPSAQAHFHIGKDCRWHGGAASATVDAPALRRDPDEPARLPPPRSIPPAFPGRLPRPGWPAGGGERLPAKAAAVRGRRAGAALPPPGSRPRLRERVPPLRRRRPRSGGGPGRVHGLRGTGP